MARPGLSRTHGDEPIACLILVTAANAEPDADVQRRIALPGRIDEGSFMSVRPIWRALVPLTALATMLGLAATAQASTTQAAAVKAKPKGTEMQRREHRAFGRGAGGQLGPYKGFTLYFISSDNAPHSYGCTPGVPTRWSARSPARALQRP